MKSSPKIIIPVIVLVFLAVVLIVFLMRNAPFGSQANTSNINSITVTSGNNTFTLDSSGNAVWNIDGETSSKLWEHDKTQSFFNYIFATYGATDHVTVSGNDELINQVFNEGSGGSGNGGGTGGDIGGYFGSPTPSGSSGGGTGGTGGNGGSGGGGNGGGGDSGIPDWCVHWKLSYCADTPPPSYSPTATPTPTGGPTPLPPDCNDPGNQQTGRTVIGNELCLPSPTP